MRSFSSTTPSDSEKYWSLEELQDDGIGFWHTGWYRDGYSIGNPETLHISAASAGFNGENFAKICINDMPVKVEYN